MYIHAFIFYYPPFSSLYSPLLSTSYVYYNRYSPALGKFYIITDGPEKKFWGVLDEAIVAMGFTSLWSKMKLPVWLMMSLAYITVFIG